jgi:hypothetical protein
MSTRNYDTLVLTVGKHKYDTFAYIYENDESYCNWILDQEEFDNESLNAFYNYIILRDYYENTSKSNRRSDKNSRINVSIHIND